MKNFLSILFCLSFVSLFADIDGTYRVSGMDPYEKKTYSGTAVITKDNGVYQAAWTLDNGETDKGTGIMQNNEASFVFVGKYPGVQIYQITGDTLQGSWVYYGKTLIGTERLVKQ